jgi:CheY-like chemotaxis protein
MMAGMYRLLYIEDNPVNALIVEELLASRSDIALRIAETGAEGLALAGDWRPDFVLLDQQLPDTSGSALLPQLRAVLPQARCVSLSASGESLAGFDACRAKPIDFAVFRAGIARWLPAAS